MGATWGLSPLPDAGGVLRRRQGRGSKAETGEARATGRRRGWGWDGEPGRGYRNRNGKGKKLRACGNEGTKERGDRGPAGEQGRWGEWSSGRLGKEKWRFRCPPEPPPPPPATPPCSLFISWANTPRFPRIAHSQPCSCPPARPRNPICLQSQPNGPGCSQGRGSARAVPWATGACAQLRWHHPGNGLENPPPTPSSAQVCSSHPHTETEGRAELPKVSGGQGIKRLLWK